jgi:hypothetical protein
MEVKTTHVLYFGDRPGDLDEAADVSERLGYSEMVLVRGADGTVRGETAVPPRDVPDNEVVYDEDDGVEEGS